MKKIDRFIVWLCKKFTKAELESIIAGLLDVLANRNPEVKPRDDFKEKHPNYQNFSVDPNPPIIKQQISKEQEKPVKNWHSILKDFFKKHDKPLKPIHHKKKG